MNKLGLIAGGGTFPLLVAREAKKEGRGVITVALKGEAEEGVEGCSDKTIWVRLGELGKVARVFREEGVTEAVMAGYVRKPNIFSGNVLPDLDMVRLLAGVRDWKDETLLSALAEFLEKKGVRLVDSTALIRDALPKEGVLTKLKPTAKEEKDIQFGYEVAKDMALRDIGQTVVVRDQCVVAVEAMEGTDETIRRGGRLAGLHAVVVKVSRPAQDMRFDVPVMGLETVRTATEAGVRVLAVEAGKTILLDRDEMVRMADEKGMCLVAIRGMNHPDKET